MAMKVFNTLTRKKEVFKPIKGKEVRMYTCGPTVYDFAHIGNFRAFVFEDTLRRVLEFNGFKIKHVMNITDVGHLTSDADTGEDKIELGAKREHKTAWEIAEFYTKAFFEDAEKLNILKPHIVSKATEHIKEQIDLIKKLEEKEFTYVIEDGVYFDTSKLKDYGKLSRMKLEELKAGARVELVPGKRNPTDFALWKFSPKDKKRQMEWESSWGVGFPGWHLECSAMSMKYLGKTFDIHCGGVDHIPIHHTNEIAQSEGATGKKFVNYWLHCEFLVVEGKKMAKSLGNFYTLRDILSKGYSSLALRYLYLTSHYREKLNLTFKALEDAQKTLNSLYDFIQRVKEVKGRKNNPKVKQLIKVVRKDFLDSVNDDLNTPKALASIFDFVKEINKLIAGNKLSKKNSDDIIKTILNFDKILGLNLGKVKKEKPSKEIEKLIQEREKARKKEDFKTADEIRKILKEEFGIILEDTKKGVRWKRIK